MAQGQGQDVALLGEEQAHTESADKGDGDEDGVGPVEGAEDEAGECGGDDRVFAIGRVCIESRGRVDWRRVAVAYKKRFIR